MTNLIKRYRKQYGEIKSRIPGGDYFRKSDFIQRYLGFAALDSVYTWMTATVMHKTNGAKHLKNGCFRQKEAQIFP